MSHINDCTNRELSVAVLDCLRELKSRGNKSLDSAIETVSSFHDNLIVLQEKAELLDKELDSTIIKAMRTD